MVCKGEVRRPSSKNLKVGLSIVFSILLFTISILFDTIEGDILKDYPLKEFKNQKIVYFRKGVKLAYFRKLKKTKMSILEL